MDSRQLVKYAINRQSKGTSFSIKKDGEIVAGGKFLNAYYALCDLALVPIMGDNFVTICQMQERFGHGITFDVENNEAD